MPRRYGTFRERGARQLLHHVHTSILEREAAHHFSQATACRAQLAVLSLGTEKAPAVLVHGSETLHVSRGDHAGE